jgi:hypothetical protein
MNSNRTDRSQQRAVIMRTMQWTSKSTNVCKVKNARRVTIKPCNGIVSKPIDAALVLGAFGLIQNPKTDTLLAFIWKWLAMYCLVATWCLVTTARTRSST